MTRHRALSLSSDGQVRLCQVQSADPSEDAGVVEVCVAGICGTDLQIANGQRPDAAAILGHEGVGRVVAINGMLKSCGQSLQEGQLVLFNPVNEFDQDTVLGHSYDGLFQDRLIVSRPQLEAGLCVPWNPRVPILGGALAEPLAAVLYGEDLVLGACSGRRIVVVGAGPVGVLAALRAREVGASQVLLMSHSAERLQWAVSASVVEPEEAILAGPNAINEILEHTDGGCDAAYMCTARAGAWAALEGAFQYVRAGGCVDLISGVGRNPPSAPDRLSGLADVRRENTCGSRGGPSYKMARVHPDKTILVTGHRGTSAAHLTRSMELLAGAWQRYSVAITHVISPDEAVPVFNMLSSATTRRIDGRECVKVAIDFSLGR